jgi:hypothetical protein
MLKPGDTIRNRRNHQTYTVTRVNVDGTLEVKGQSKRRRLIMRRITRPEFYTRTDDRTRAGGV